MIDDFVTLARDECLNTKVEQVLAWANERNIIKGSTYKDQYIKAVSEIGELADALLTNNKDWAEDAIGDVIVCLINLAEMCGTDLNTCLERAYNEIKDRKGIMFNGVFVKSTDDNYERILNHVKSESMQMSLFGEKGNLFSKD